MGYESKIYVVNKWHGSEENGKCYAEKIAELKMSKCGDFCSVFSKKTDCFIYQDDGNTPILEDKYGDELKEAAVDDVVDWLKTTISGGEDYRRFKMALALLKSFQTEQWERENIAVLHYGY